jgi:hypothetical protein
VERQERPASIRGFAGWAAWAAVLAALSWGGVSHERERFLRSSEGYATFSLSPWRLLEEVRMDLTNDGDIRRYFAYANAALGQPYQRGFVRPLTAWLETFASGAPSDPDLDGVASPPSPLLPYRDYLVEYPPGFFLWTLPPALLARGPEAFAALFCGAMAALLTGALLLCRRLASNMGGNEALSRSLPAFAAGALALLGVVATHRLDATVSLLVCAAAWAAVERRAALSGAALGLAVATKLVPALIAPLLLVYLVLDARSRGQDGRAGAWRFSLALGLTALAFCAPLLLLGPGRAADLLRYHALRPPQVESTAAAMIGVARVFAPSLATASYTFGSLNLDGPAAAALSRLSNGLGALAVLAALAVSIARLRRAGSPQERTCALVDGLVGLLLAFIAFSKVLSPQYLVWLLPLALLAALRRRGAALALVLAAFGLTQVIYPYSLGALARLEVWPYALVLARNLLLVALAAVLLRAPGKAEGPRSSWNLGPSAE